jgi:hypothetical protein
MSEAGTISKLGMLTSAVFDAVRPRLSVNSREMT